MSSGFDYANPTPLDLAGYYVEDLKYGAGDGVVETVTRERMVHQLEVLLRDAGVSSMTGAELLAAVIPYGRGLSGHLGIPEILARSIFVDGLMFGIALAGGLSGTDPRERLGGAA